MSHCWDFFLLMIILITASLSSDTYKKASWCEDWTLDGTQSMIFSTLVFPWDFRILSVITGVPSLSVAWDMFPRTETIRYHKSREGLGICWDVSHWSLFLTQSTYWNKCMTSKDAQCSSRSEFGIHKISSKIGVFKQSQSALFCGITHKATLFQFTCVMNGRYQTI